MQVIEGALLKDYTSYKLGGPAKSLIIVETVDELLNLDKDVLREAIVIGGGTNILVSDKGVDKDVVKIAFSGYSYGPIISALAGTNLTEMAIELVRQGYIDFLFAVGIPGTVGGAVVMNAGTDKFISDVLTSVEVVTRDGEKKTLLADELQYDYRNSILQNKDWIVVQAFFHGRKEEPLLEEEFQIQLNRRKEGHPTSFPSAGCWFKGAWGHNDVIEKVGMDGEWRGGAVSSPLFPAFILNVGATANDIYSLVKEIETKAEAIGKPLTREIKLIGEFDA